MTYDNLYSGFKKLFPECDVTLEEYARKANADEDDGMHIVVDRNMRTNIPGCFACGDCTGRPYQYMKAAGEGNIAAHSVVDFLTN